MIISKKESILLNLSDLIDDAIGEMHNAMDLNIHDQSHINLAEQILNRALNIIEKELNS